VSLFRYKAISDSGKVISGVIDADSFSLAKERLRKQQILVTELGTLKKNSSIQLDDTLLLNFTREFGQLLRAGLPVYESLLTIEEKYRAHRVHPLFLDLCDQLKSGSSLSLALKKYPGSFDAVFLSMVESAEQTGALVTVFNQLSTLIEKQRRLKKKLYGALLYPAFLAAFALLVTFSLLYFVIPSMSDLFEGRKLHPLTETVLGISRFVTSNTIPLLLGVLLVATGVPLFLRTAQGKRLREKLLLKTPLLKTLLIQAALVRLTRSLSLLLAGGVPLLQALGLSRKVVGLFSLEQLLERAEKKIMEGGKLSSEFKTSPLIPPLVIRILAIAEETGKIAPMLQSIADIYDEELENQLAQITVLLQPALLLILGAVIGLILLSVLLPLTDVSSFVSN